ncbi:MAG TPA: DUF4129 domain-containing protein [Streptosporangiaceae bacterium]|nr:DUF4129 domain-containing protein [Streptosporangiaceae bacterium]
MITDPAGRDQARELARRELEKPIYHRNDPSTLDRFLSKIMGWLGSLLPKGGGPGSAQGHGTGVLTLVLVLTALVAIIAGILWWSRKARNVKSDRGALLGEKPSAARDHRAAAEQYAAAGQWPEAIRERLRAIARDLEERVILQPRPGRTADELAAEAALALPDHAAELAAGIRIFDDVWYGDRPGSAAGYAQLKTLDERVQTARPRPLETV